LRVWVFSRGDASPHRSVKPVAEQRAQAIRGVGLASPGRVARGELPPGRNVGPRVGCRERRS
jgi:hypothetical protein